MYGLLVKNTGKLARLNYSANDGENCFSVSFDLTQYDVGPFYLVENKESAIRTLSDNCPWYNADYNTPSWGHFKPEDLEIVEVEFNIIKKENS